ncbi:unnamed protein product [Urochloa decumbens]|uniref:ENT domain-containing protein n=1 Tax=Urochloa decumbens TaxID=240449 RepID=A0ABC9FHV3_9POAL
MSASSGRLCDRVPLSDITKRNGQHVNYESSLYGQKGNGSYHTDAGGSCTKLAGDRCPRDNADCAVHSAATVMGNPYMPGVMKSQEQGSSEPYELLSYGYNAPTAKNIGDLNGAHSWVQAHPEEHKMIQTSLELLMSQRKNVQAPIFSGSYGGGLTNATSLQVQGYNMIQTPLEMQMSQSRNICPPNLSGSTYSSNGYWMIQTPSDLVMSESRNVGLTNSTGPAVVGEPSNIPSPQVHGTAYSSSGHKMIQTPWQMLMSRNRNVCPPKFSGSTYAMEMASIANPQVHSTSYSSRGNRMVQTPIDLLMSESRHVPLPNSTGFAAGGQPTSVPSSHVHGTVYSSSGYEMIQTPLEMLVSQRRNVCPPNLSGSTYGMEFASVANPQVHSTSYSSRGHRMIQTPMDQIESFNVALPNSTGSSVGREPTNIPSSQVHGTVYSSKGHKTIQTPLEMLMSQSRNVFPPNLSGSSFAAEVASVANPQVHNTAYSSSGQGMIQTPTDLLMSESRNIALPNSTVSAVSMELTNVPSSQVHGSAYSSSETEDDLPPPSLDMRGCGRLSGEGRAIVPVSSHARAQTDMEAQIHQLEHGTNNDDDLPPTSLNGSEMRGSGHVGGNGRAVVLASSYARAQINTEAQIDQLEHGADSDDDLPPPYSNSRDMRGSEHVDGNGKAVVPTSPHARAQTDKEAQIHHLEHGADGDDDFPPPYSNSRDMRGSEHVSGNGKAIVPTSPHARAQTDMKAQIHQLEQQAYYLVLRAFKARSDTITWEKEDLITELREELRVSDEAHRQLLNRINNDDLTHSTREWRTTGGLEESLPNNPSLDPVSNHIAPSHKRQNTLKSVTASLAPPPVMHSERVATPTQPFSSTAVKAVPLQTKGKKTKPFLKVSKSSAVKPTTSSEGPPSARRPLMNRYFPGGPAAEFSQAQNVNPLIGRKVMSRWPDDNSFYEVVICDYNPETGLYALVYDINTSNETWEWVDLEKMEPEDIRWIEDDSGIDPVTYLQSQGAPSSRARKSTSCGGLIPGHGRGRSFQNNVSKKDFPPPINNARKRGSGDIDIFHTESLIKRVEKVFSISNPDPLEAEKAKKALKEQEHSLVDAIARLAETSADESDGHNRGHRKKTVKRS